MSNLKQLSEDEASKEMKKMVAFIMQEATEKSREIQVKADEEFNIEKAKLVRQDTVAIEQHYARKLKQAEVRRRIAQSAQINKVRLQVLQARDKVLDEIVQEAKVQLGAVSSDPAAYEELVKNLVLQSLFSLMDEKVVVTCRAQDEPVVEKAILHCIPQFAQQAGIRVSVQLDSKNLPPHSSGGVVISSHNGRIRSDNTLEARLDDVFHKMMPALRVRLYGHPENRKFFD